MKVKQLIEQLKAYDGETDLIVAYWDKETIEGYTDGLEMTTEQWAQVVDEYEDGEFFFQGSAAEDFVDLAEKVVSDWEEDD